MIISKKTKNDDGEIVNSCFCKINFDVKELVLEDGSEFGYMEAFIDGEVNEDMHDSFICMFDEVDARINMLRHCDEIRIIFSSNGGCVHSGLKIINLINMFNYSHKMQISFIANGLNASMSVPIICSGVNRYCFENSKFLIHSVSSGAIGKISDMKSELMYSEDLQNEIIEIISSNTFLKKEEISQLIKEEHYFNAKKALEYGLVHTIISFKEEVAEPEESKEENKKKREK